MIVLAVLSILNVSPLCVAGTNVCAPPGSTFKGTVTHTGGEVTITPSQPMRALGSEFRAGSSLVVTVLPWWSSDKTSGAIVHVTGALTKEAQISGARVVGTVRIGQVQGARTPRQPQLVGANEITAGKLTFGTAETIDVGPGMKVSGRVDIGGVNISIASETPQRALGLDFSSGILRIDRGPDSTLVDGTLIRPQEILGVLVEGRVRATFGGSAPGFRFATLARATPLRALGLPDGDAPAGTVVQTTSESTLLVGPGPFTVCGLSFLPIATFSQKALEFSPSGPQSHVTVNGKIVGEVDVGGGLFMTAMVRLRLDRASCQLRGVEGNLSRPAVHLGLPFAERTALAATEEAQSREMIVSGTLAKPAVIDGLKFAAKPIVVRAPNPDEVHVLEGTLAQDAPFEQWHVPAGTQVQRFGIGWSFKVPPGKDARAVAVHRGERVDRVIESRSDDRMTTFTLRHPHTPNGTTLALRGLGIEHHTGCVVGDVARPQRIGLFGIPEGGSATVCAGNVFTTRGAYAVPSLRVGKWYATVAVAGDRASPPPQEGSGLPLTPSRPLTSAPTGYWIQINPLCLGDSGIPMSPPPQKWIWVDATGEPATQREREELVRRASKPGAPCPVSQCCRP